MKRYSTFLIGCLVALFYVTTSCSSSDNQSTTVNNPNFLRAGAAIGIREDLNVNKQVFKFQGKEISINTEDIIAIKKAVISAEDEDAADVLNLNESFLRAKKEAQELDITFNMSDEPVTNGVFIFGIETQEAKDLTLELYDEEGFGLVANNQFNVLSGSNYKALNVKELDAGEYNFRLLDAQGKELNRSIKIQH